MGVTSCHDQELAQIVEICVACKCLEFFFSFFLITVDVWVSLPATIKNWPNLHKLVLEVNVWSFFFSFLITVRVWVSLLATIKNWPKLQRFVL